MGQTFSRLYKSLSIFAQLACTELCFSTLLVLGDAATVAGTTAHSALLALS